MDRAVNNSGTDQSNRSAGPIRNVSSTGYVHVGGVNLNVVLRTLLVTTK